MAFSIISPGGAMRILFYTLAIFIAADQAAAKPIATPHFSSPTASENLVSFESWYRSEFGTLAEVEALTPVERQRLVGGEIKSLFKFLFGPATRRKIGGPKGEDMVTVAWERARLVGDRVELPVRYRGVWILDGAYASREKLVLPVPRTSELYTERWKACGDSDPEHATPSFFWYFWDPSRIGCDHVRGVHYDEVEFTIGTATRNESLSYPEYSRMIRELNGVPTLSMTIAFGYATDRSDPNPEADMDVGANEYRTFLRSVRSWNREWKEEMIFAHQYPDTRSRLVIGRKFSARIHGVETVIKVVINAGVDQMVLFAESFAHDHDAVFAWMGHSRVGEGFDAAKFRGLLHRRPDHYSVSSDYQLIYWGGCNSYSYYTLPFFQFKAGRPGDPHGTRDLDIIAHGLPSYFILNAVNAESVVAAVLNWPTRPSYQSILQELEESGAYVGTKLLAAVLGDEDNPR